MVLRSNVGWRCAAFSLVLASSGLANAGWYSWLGSNSDYGTAGNWFDQTTSATATQVPGVTDDVQINGFSGGTDTVVLDQARTHRNGEFYSATLDLSGSSLTFTGSITSASFNLRNGAVNFGSGYSVQSYFPGGSTFDTLTGSFGGIGVVEGASLTISNSNLTTGGFYSQGTLSLQSTTLTGTDSTIGGSATIDAGSSLNLDFAGDPNSSSFSLRTSTGAISVLGLLTTHGVRMGSFFDTGANSVTVGATGTWIDDSDTAAKSVGKGSHGSIDIDGGTVRLLGNVNIGEGDADFDNAPVDGQGSVSVRNGGNLTLGRVSLGGWSPYAGVSTATGSLDVQGSTFVASEIRSVDDGNLNRGSGSIQIGTGSAANVGSLLGGALNLDSGRIALQFSLLIDGGSSYTGGFLQLIGSAGKTVDATFRDSNTSVDIQNLSVFNGATFAIRDGATAKLSSIEIGQNGTTIGSSGLLQGGPVYFHSDTSDTSIVHVNDGRLDFVQSNITVDPAQGFAFNAIPTGRNALLTFDRTTLQGPSGLIVGNMNATSAGTARVEIKDSTLTFEDANISLGLIHGLVAIGDDGSGSASIENSTLKSWRFRTGFGAGGNGDVVVRNSDIYAYSDEFTAASPGAIMIGKTGQAKVELFNSNLYGDVIYIGANGLLKGDGSLNGNPLSSPGLEVLNFGTIAPGHSPGKLSVNGDLKLMSSSVLEMEIDLSDPSHYDQILTSGVASLGGTLHLKALGTGTFDLTRSYSLLTASSFLGGFAHYEIDPAFGITASAFSFNGGTFGINPQAVPEPGSIVALGGGALAFVRRRKTVRAKVRGV